MVMKILIFGGNGWIGTQFRDVCDRANLGGSHIEYKISQIRRVSLESQGDIIEEITAYMPTHVVSFLGRTHGSVGSKTYSTIDYLEQEGKLSENMRDNLIAPLLLAYICKYANIHYTYLGTGCIFHYKEEDIQKMLGYDNREDPAGSEIETCYKFKETDAPNFFGSSYSIVKGLTDQIMQERNCICESVLNLRIRMPIINRDHPRNFVTKITGYSKICSLPNSMTVLDEFLPYALALMQCRYVGTLNFVNPGVISHNEMLRMYRQFVNPEFEWTNFTVDEQNEILSSKRSNNYLDTAKLESIFPKVRNIQDAVQDCMISYNNPPGGQDEPKKIILSQIQCNARIVHPCLGVSVSGVCDDDDYGDDNRSDNKGGVLLKKGGEILVNAAQYAGACTRILSKTVGELYTKMLHHKPNFSSHDRTSEMRLRMTESAAVESVVVPAPVPIKHRPVEVLSTLVDDDTTVVCITGGAGFIGSHFINFIWAKYSKLKIINLDCMYYCSNILNINAEIREDEGGRYKFYKTDLANAQAVTELRGILNTHAVTHIVHFAAQSHVQNSFGESLQYTRDNVMGTHNLLEAARLYGKIQRFIHVSTDEVYGESDSIGDCKTESSLLSPTNPYAATKAAAEMIAQSYYRSFKLPLIITRGNNVYGPNQYPEKLIPRFVSLLQCGKKLTVQGTGDNIRSFIHVSDVCSAFDIILSKGTTGEIYNIGGDESSDYSVMAIAKILIKEINGDTAIGDTSSDVDWIEYVDDRPFNDKRYYISNDKLKQLGWKPQVDFMDGIRDLIKKTRT